MKIQNYEYYEHYMINSNLNLPVDNSELRIPNKIQNKEYYEHCMIIPKNTSW